MVHAFFVVFELLEFIPGKVKNAFGNGRCFMPLLVIAVAEGFFTYWLIAIATTETSCLLSFGVIHRIKLLFQKQ